MGLDVYLYTKAQQLANEASTREENEFYGGEEWPLYQQKTEEEKDEFRKNRKYEAYTSYTDTPSRVYPGEATLNNRRYLRSSYNGAGFNAAVPHMLGRPARYEWIFEEVIDIAGEEYDKWLTEEHIPALRTAVERADGIASELEALPVALNVITESPNPYVSEVASLTEAQALDWTREQLLRVKDDDPFWGGGWSNREGTFHGAKSPIEVVAVVPGVDYAGRPGAVHLVYKNTDAAVRSYVQSAVIAGEFAEEAIELIGADGSCYMSWSG